MSPQKRPGAHSTDGQQSEILHTDHYRKHMKWYTSVHLIQNIDLSQSMADTCSVSQPVDRKGAQAYPPTPLVTWWLPWKCFFLKGEPHVHVIRTCQTGISTHTDSQAHQWGLCGANHRLSVWLMLHCLVPHNYIQNNPEPQRSLAAKSCVALQNIQAPFQNSHNWLKCNHLTEAIKVCF